MFIICLTNRPNKERTLNTVMNQTTVRNYQEAVAAYAQAAKGLNATIMSYDDLIRHKESLPKEVRDIIGTDGLDNQPISRQSPFVEGLKLKIDFNDPDLLLVSIPNRPEKKEGEEEKDWEPRLSFALKAYAVNDDGKPVRDLQIFMGMLSPAESSKLDVKGQYHDFISESINRRLTNYTIGDLRSGLKAEFGSDAIICKIKRGERYTTVNSYTGKTVVKSLVNLLLVDKAETDFDYVDFVEVKEEPKQEEHKQAPTSVGDRLTSTEE